MGISSIVYRIVSNIIPLAGHPNKNHALKEYGFYLDALRWRLEVYAWKRSVWVSPSRGAIYILPGMAGKALYFDTLVEQ